MMPASASGLVASAITSVSPRNCSDSPLSSVRVSPGRAIRTRISRSSSERSKGVHRLAELEHHVVGDVDDRADRADAAAAQPLLDPQRRLGRRVDAAHAAADVARAGRRRVQRDAETIVAARDDSIDRGRRERSALIAETSRAIPATLRQSPRSA